MEDTGRSSLVWALRMLRSRWTIALGAVMIALGLYMIWLNWDDADICYMLAQTVMVLFGVLMFLNPVKSTMNNVAMYALGLGLSRMLKCIPYLVSENTGVFLVGAGMMAVGASLTYTGYMFIKGRARAYRRMIYTSSLVFFVMIYTVALMNFAYIHGLMEIQDQYDLIIETALMCLLYGCLAFVLMDERISSRGYYETVHSDLTSLGLVNNLPADLTILPADAEVLSDRDHEGWVPVEDGGPVLSEHRFRVSAGGTSLYCTAQIWKGDDRIFFTISTVDRGTVIQASRFGADTVVPEDGGLRLLGRDGFTARFTVSGEGSA